MDLMLGGAGVSNRFGAPLLALSLLSMTACAGAATITVEGPDDAVERGAQQAPSEPGGDEAAEGRRFQAAVLADGRVTYEEYEQAISRTVQCLRAAGFVVNYPADDLRAIVDLAIDPDHILTYAVRVSPAHDQSRADRCAHIWSQDVEAAWLDQLRPSAEERQRALEAAWDCGRERGMTTSEPLNEADAHRAVTDFGCRPWEAIQ